MLINYHWFQIISDVRPFGRPEQVLRLRIRGKNDLASSYNVWLFDLKFVDIIRITSSNVFYGLRERVFINIYHL